MRFRWIKQTSRLACISAIVIRALLKGMNLEEAVKASLPHYSVNPESISQLEYRRLLKDAKIELKRVEESRRSCTDYQRQRG
ncbi:hypothetical protein DMN77_18835 [Paenibacillus sp. 79R4]|nr:hypothetical protein [Paenibacillus sp. 79R4]